MQLTIPIAISQLEVYTESVITVMDNLPHVHVYSIYIYMICNDAYTRKWRAR